MPVEAPEVREAEEPGGRVDPDVPRANRPGVEVERVQSLACTLERGTLRSDYEPDSLCEPVLVVVAPPSVDVPLDESLEPDPVELDPDDSTGSLGSSRTRTAVPSWSCWKVNR